MTTTLLHIGLRFDRRDSDRLFKLADLVRSKQLQGDVSTYEEAAIAATTGEPLLVICTDPGQAHAMAAGYIALGCRPPAVEELTQPGR